MAAAVRQTIADTLLAGNTDLVPLTNTSVRLAGLPLQNAGPFADEGDRYGDQFGGGVLAGARDNNFEGAYLDDFIIGFAERGELATGSNPVTDQAFVADERFAFATPADPVDPLDSADYTFEIRDASEYAIANSAGGNAGDTRFRSFDTNDQLGVAASIELPAGNTIRDGQGFSVSDGRDSIRFEFDEVALGDGVSFGNGVSVAGAVPVPFSSTDSASQIAAAVASAFDRPEVRNSRLDVSAQFSSGQITSGNGESRLNILGDPVISDDDGVLVDIDRSTRRGDTNRERSEGVLIIEQNRFLFNVNYGVEIAAGETATIAGEEVPSLVRYARNLQELNTENLNPGLVLQSNVMAYNDVAGLRIEGFEDLDSTLAPPATLDKILNNTIIGGSIEASVGSPIGIAGGVLFPGGRTSFADVVIEYDPTQSQLAPAGPFRDEDTVLGAPRRRRHRRRSHRRRHRGVARFGRAASPSNSSTTS